MIWSLHLLFFSLILGCAPKMTYLNQGRLNSKIFTQSSFQVDSQASEILLHSSPLTHSSSVIAESFHRSVEQVLNQGRQPTSESIPLRYRVEILDKRSNYLWILFPCLYALIYFGCPLNSETVNIKLSVEVQGWIYTEEIEDVTYIGLYYNQELFSALQKTMLTGFQKLGTQIDQHRSQRSQSLLK